LGALGFSRLIARFGSASAVLDAVPDLGRLSPPPKAGAEAELQRLDRLGARLIASCEPDFPALRAALDPAPPGSSSLRRPPLTLAGPD